MVGVVTLLSAAGRGCPDALVPCASATPGRTTANGPMTGDDQLTSTSRGNREDEVETRTDMLYHRLSCLQ